MRAAVVVTYRPSIDRLQHALIAVSQQVDHVYIIDNGDGASSKKALSGLESCLSGCADAGCFTLVVLQSNRGVAFAQNMGAQRAFDSGADFVLLLDQDSIPGFGMVNELVSVYQSLILTGHRIAAVGAMQSDINDAGSFVKFGWFRHIVLPTPEAERWLFCDMLISSGSLISREAWHEIGPTDCSLFIDKVDTEWCLRATSRGYQLAGAPRAVLQHKLGESNVRVWWLKWRILPTHKPFRYYYMVRNAFALYPRPYATWRWRSADFKRTLFLLLFFGILLPQRRLNLPWMLRGLKDAALGRAGPSSGNSSNPQQCPE